MSEPKPRPARARTSEAAERARVRRKIRGHTEDIMRARRAIIDLQERLDEAGAAPQIWVVRKGLEIEALYFSEAAYLAAAERTK